MSSSKISSSFDVSSKVGAVSGGTYQKVTWLETTLKSMLEGKKPLLDPENLDHEKLIRQLEKMYAEHFISEDVVSYFTHPNDTQESISNKGITVDHPLSHALTSCAIPVSRGLDEAKFNNYVIAGYNIRYRDVSKGDEILSSTNNLIVEKGDLYSAWQFILQLKQNIKNADEDKPITPIFVETESDYWDDLLSIAEVKKLPEDLAPVGYTNESIISQFRNKAIDPEEDRTLVESLFSIPRGSHLLLVSSNPKKLDELKAIAETLNLDVEIHLFSRVVGKPLEALETSKTYAGNNQEKIDTARQRIQELGEEDVRRRIEMMGLNPDNMFLIVDDRGLCLPNIDLESENIFPEAGKMNPHKTKPGVETASLFKALSIDEVYSRVRSIIRRATERIGELFKNSNLSIVYDHCVYTITPLFHDQNGKPPSCSFYAATTDKILENPDLVPGQARYSEDHLTPSLWGEGKPKAQIPNYINQQSCMALAVIALKNSLNMPSMKPALRAAFSGIKRSIYKIGTQLNLDVTAAVTGVNTEMMRKLGSAIALSSDNHCGGKVSDFAEFTEGVDGFLLLPETPVEKGADDPRFWNKLYEFMSLVVGKQVEDPHVREKPFGILRPQEDRTWDVPLQIFHSFHAEGLIGQKPQYIFSEYPNIKAAKKDINEKNKRNKHTVPQKEISFHEMKPRPQGAKFKVTCYGSASTTHKDLLRCGFDFSKKLGLKIPNVVLKHGGGMDGTMEQFTLGLNAAKPDVSVENAPQVWAIQCNDTVLSEGVGEGNDYVCIHPDIYQRMEDLTATDAEVVFAGGAGTVQEIARSVLRRQRGEVDAQKVPLVIVNQNIPKQDDPAFNIFDALIEHIPDGDYAKYNIHVVSNEDKALEIVQEAYQKWQADNTLVCASRPFASYTPTYH